MYRTPWFLSLLAGALVFLPRLDAAETRWRDGYISHEGSESPNERYGVVIPSFDAAGGDEENVPNYLADLKKHVLLGRIDASHYYESRNHFGIVTTWAEDSSWCVVVFDRRFGFHTITALEITGVKVSQVEIGKYIHSALDAVIAQESRNKDDGGEGGAFFHLGEDRKLRVRAIATTNPKAFPNQKNYRALFQGTYDMKARKWGVQDTRPIGSEEEEEALRYTFETVNLEGSSFTSDDERLTWLDERLNSVYRALRFLLKPERFAQIKTEQVAWLKRRDATQSPAEKSKLLEARIKALQTLVW